MPLEGPFVAAFLISLLWFFISWFSFFGAVFADIVRSGNARFLFRGSSYGGSHIASWMLAESTSRIKSSSLGKFGWASIRYSAVATLGFAVFAILAHAIL